jgi:hypothetical protein
VLSLDVFLSLIPWKDNNEKIILITLTAIIAACSAPTHNDIKTDNSSIESNSASDGKNQANSFTNIYAFTCLKYLNNLDDLRNKLKQAPTLPPEKAQYFLAGHDGDAWPVPDKHGIFVLVIFKEKDFCAVHARGADTEEVNKQFDRIVATAPYPLTAKQVQNEKRHTTANGLTQTIAYEWSIPDAPVKMLFTLSTASSENANIQALASAGIISK